MSAPPPRRREPADLLLSIGEFARRSRLSPRALRLYERQGLLLPAEVDDANSYRYYRHSQLPDARLISRADAAAARAGEIILIFYREVTADSDGPVEICLPVDGDAATKAGLLTRVEPPHREAYTRLVRADTEYPQILAGYDAVFAW